MFLFRKPKIFFFTLVFAFLFLIVNQVLAGDTGEGVNNALGNLDVTAGNAGLKTAQTSLPLPNLIGQIVGVALSFLGVIFFILMIYGGYMWMFSMGNEQTVSKAKSIIIAAVIGLAIVLMAYAITAYLGSQFTKIPTA